MNIEILKRIIIDILIFSLILLMYDRTIQARATNNIQSTGKLIYENPETGEQDLVIDASDIKGLRNELIDITNSFGTFNCDNAVITVDQASRYGNIIQARFKISPLVDWKNGEKLIVTPGTEYKPVTVTTKRGIIIEIAVYYDGSIIFENKSGTTISSGAEHYIDILYMTR